MSGVDGRSIGDFAVERRVVIGYDDIAPDLRMAIIAAEDGDFNSHFGLSISRIAVTLVRDVIEWINDLLRGQKSRPAGASTLTQQLARKLMPEAVGFQEGDISLERKVREALIAIQIEKRYTKREILTLYCNQMYWGHNAYGVEAASRLYFAKSAKDLTLEEAAMLAGIIQGNVRQSPYVNMDAAVRRRNYTLDRMVDEGFISPERGDEAKAKPIVVRGEPRQPPSIAPYFLEEVRKHLEARYGAKRLYESGLSVKTTLDPGLQDAANRAMANGLRRIDKRRGYRRATRNVLAEKQTVADVHARAVESADGRRRRRARGRVCGRTPGASRSRPRQGRQVSGRPHQGELRGMAAHACRLRHLPSATSSTWGLPRSTKRPARSNSFWNRRRSWRARSSRSTTAPARSAPWSAGGASAGASSTGRFRPTASLDRRSNRSSTPRPSIAG